VHEYISIFFHCCNELQPVHELSNVLYE
jgi:hypothetical protein